MPQIIDIILKIIYNKLALKKLKGEYIVKYEILKEGTGLQFCKYNAKAGVSVEADERHIFQMILQSRNIDQYVCPSCIYLVVGPQYDVLFKNLSMISNINNRLFVTLENGDRIEVTSQNFSIMCCLEHSDCPEPWVKIYYPKKHSHL